MVLVMKVDITRLGNSDLSNRQKVNGCFYQQILRQIFVTQESPYSHRFQFRAKRKDIGSSTKWY